MEENKLLKYEAGKKSLFLSFVLTFLFGPLGLFYVSEWAAIIMLAILFAIVVIGGWTGILALGLGGAFVYWGICMAIGLLIAHNHNQGLLKKIMSEELYMGNELDTKSNEITREDSENGNETLPAQDIKHEESNSYEKIVVLFVGITVIAFISFLLLKHYGVIDKSGNDSSMNELAIGSDSGGSKKITILSDTIKLKPDSVCLNMNPFTFNTGLQVSKINGAIKPSDESNLGAYIYLIFNFKNIGSKDFSEKVKLTWKVKEDGAIKFTGTDYFYFDEVVRPGETWIKETRVLTCSPIYNGRLTFTIELNGIPMEDVTIKPKYQ